MDQFDQLERFLKKLPAIEPPLATGLIGDGLWWIKFSLDTGNHLAWRVVQELAFVVNYLSVEERLPAVFYPVSPPPYLNGGPDDFLSWVIETKDPGFTPNHLVKWLESRLPDPVDDPDEWELE